VSLTVSALPINLIGASSDHVNLLSALGSNGLDGGRLGDRERASRACLVERLSVFS
jgi:hypothetical protein